MIILLIKYFIAPYFVFVNCYPSKIDSDIDDCNYHINQQKLSYNSFLYFGKHGHHRDIDSIGKEVKKKIKCKQIN